ncbi:MAG: SWIM zinc finger family protein [Sandaracinaceae bacterium]|nr:SWIM zinc finger family protein [Sandaracinaceae bacterium]
MRRDDLLALDEAKLAELATRGHVKKAVKELEAGRGPTIEVEADGTVVAVTEDATVRLTPGSALRDTSCTCPAPKVCRHRVMAVLAYGQAHGGDADEPAARWSPAAFDDADVEALLGKWAWRRALDRQRRGYVATVSRAEEVPIAELPTCTVRFLVPDGLSYARCDCEAGVKCEHIALAVWAFRQADERHPDAPKATVEVGGGATIEASSLDAALELTRELLLDGAVGSGAALGARFARAKKPLGEAKLLWPRMICEDLEETLTSYAGRAATYHPTRVGELLTELHARARASAHEGEIPARVVLGLDEPEETALEHLRLVSLGCRLTREALEEGSYRARADVYLADPDTRAVLVLQTAWTVGEADVGAALARRHVRKDLPLGTLARGQVVTKAAKRRANQALTLAADRRGLTRTSVTPQRGEWDLFGAPLFVDDFATLAAELRDAPPRYVRPRLLAERVRVLAVEEVGDVAYDPGAQVLRARLRGRDDSSVTLLLTHSAAAPKAIDALVDAFEKGVRYVSGEVWREGDEVRVSPIGVVTDRVVALDLEAPTGKGELPTGFGSFAPEPIHELLLEARALLDRGAHAGMRHVTDAWRDELRGVAARLASAGLSGCAERAQAVHARLAGRLGGDAEAEEALAAAWLDASLRLRLALEAG